LIEENGCSIVEINNAAYKPFKLALGAPEQIMLVVAYVIKGTTINKIHALIMNRSGVLKQTFRSVMSIHVLREIERYRTGEKQ